MVLLNQYQGCSGIDLFRKSIRPKEDVIAQLEFKVGYFDVAVSNGSHYTMETPPERYIDLNLL